jgi:hypothetical protein
VSSSPARRSRLRDAQGNRLSPMLLLVLGRDEHGRPTDCRVLYDEQTIGETLSPEVKNECRLIWMTDFQLAKRTS